MIKDRNELNKIAETALDAMEDHAQKLGIPGVAVILFRSDEQAKDLCSFMRIVGAINTIAADQTGYNFIALAYSKLAESIETGRPSGNPTRSLLVGEYGYQGSAVAEIMNGFVIASFSGKTTGDVDFEIAKAGLSSLL
jgi:hypothetical protein